MALMVSNSSVANLAFAAGGLQLSSLKARNGASESLACWSCRRTTTRTIFSNCGSVRRGSLWLGKSLVEELFWKPKKPASASSTSLRLRRISAAANEKVPDEILEDSKFVAINDDDPRFGPPAMLLLGFNKDEVVDVQNLVAYMGGEFMKVLLYTKEMVKGTLNSALAAEQPDLSDVEIVQGVPHICFLSGLTGEEILMFVRTFPQSGVKDTVFASHVPNNSNKLIEELIEEIMGDHERLTKGRERAEA
ncbi:unnamed protein product [Sphagnum jensenii]|uniref:Uncharacterized protein n=1 Tax=Sphagnum jensenii TaxID=128206 RepID=A0ABP0WDI9_9BRYO